MTTTSTAWPSTSPGAVDPVRVAALAAVAAQAAAELDAAVRWGAGAQVVRRAQAHAERTERHLHHALTTTVPGYRRDHLDAEIDAVTTDAVRAAR